MTRTRRLAVSERWRHGSGWISIDHWWSDSRWNYSWHGGMALDRDPLWSPSNQNSWSRKGSVSVRPAPICAAPPTRVRNRGYFLVKTDSEGKARFPLPVERQLLLEDDPKPWRSSGNLAANNVDHVLIRSFHEDISSFDTQNVLALQDLMLKEFDLKKTRKEVFLRRFKIWKFCFRNWLNWDLIGTFQTQRRLIKI